MTRLAAPRARGADGIAAVAIMCACIAAAFAFRRGCGPRVEPGTCAAILERYVDARVRQLDPTPSASTLAASRAASAREAAERDALPRCDASLRAEAARCALDAGDADAIERCLQ